jgi:hypothetical protein
MERIRRALRTSCWDRGHGLEQLSGYDFAVLRPNFSGPAITAVVEQARGPANPDKRAAPVAEAEKPTVR